MNILEFLKNGSGIHIKEKNKGKFTSYCGGKVTDECILKGKNSSNPAIRKRATFAANARKWKHLQGGIVKALEGISMFTPITKFKPIRYAYGYPVYWSDTNSADIYDVEKFFKKRPDVTGMAVGKDEATVKSPIILRNVHSNIITDPYDPRWEGLDKLEAARHYMYETNYDPQFTISPELENFRKINFKPTDAYSTDDKAYKQSIISRIIVGDMKGTPEQEKEVNMILKELEKRKSTYKKGGILKAQKGTSFFKKAGLWIMNNKDTLMLAGSSLASAFKSNLPLIDANNAKIKANQTKNWMESYKKALAQLHDRSDIVNMHNAYLQASFGEPDKELVLLNLELAKGNELNLDFLPDLLNSFKSSKKQLASMDFKNLNSISKIAPTTDFGNGFNYNINSGLTYKPNIPLTNFLNNKWL